jgi:EAL domain-containing protein (putative c-di-GMP-specific phosphodiesterase class I)
MIKNDNEIILIFILFLLNIYLLLYNYFQNKKINKYKNNIYNKIKQKNKFIKEIENAFKNNEFKIYIQPRYNTQTEEIVGGELLVRWYKNNKIIYPNKFINKMEKYNLIKKLDLYVLNEICKKMEEWQNNKIKISINQSQKNLLNKNYIYEIRKIINKYNFNKSLLEIELTENIFIENKEVVKKLEKELHNINVQMAIDDFGTGYSSYNLLSEIKIDVLKLDKKLFNNLENERTKIIINAIIKMTKELKIESVAEGIEKKEQLEYLKKIKCDEIQGYYFSKPIPLEEFEKKIINKKNNNEK